MTGTGYEEHSRRMPAAVALLVAIVAFGCAAVPPPLTEPSPGAVAPASISTTALASVPLAAPSAAFDPGAGSVPPSGWTPSPAPVLASASPPVPPLASSDPAASLTAPPPATGTGLPSPTAAPLPPAVPSGPVARDPRLGSRLQAVLRDTHEKFPIPGLAAVVVMPDGSVWSSAAGQANVATRRPVTSDTSFSVGSITKTFIAALTLQLVDEGRIRLDDPLSRWMPRFRNARNITIRQLLDHTSGIHNYFENPRYNGLVFDQPGKRWSVDEILRLVQAPYFPPGRGYHYSNTNYVLLGAVLERVTGRNIAVELRRRFLTPLGLDATFFQGEERIRVTPAEGYLRSSGRFIGFSDRRGLVPNTSAATVAWTAGAMISNVHDLAAWAEALYGGRLLSPASQRQLLAFNRYDYGLGTRRIVVNGREGVGHTGSLRGFTSAMWHFTAERVTVVVLTNRGRINPSTIARRLLAVVSPRLPPPLLPPSPSPSGSQPGASPAAPTSRARPTPSGPPVPRPAPAGSPVPSRSPA